MTLLREVMFEHWAAAHLTKKWTPPRPARFHDDCPSQAAILSIFNMSKGCPTSPACDLLPAGHFLTEAGLPRRLVGLGEVAGEVRLPGVLFLRGRPRFLGGVTSTSDTSSCALATALLIAGDCIPTNSSQAEEGAALLQDDSLHWIWWSFVGMLWHDSSRQGSSRP